jgi:GTP cyclohydrolase II
VLIMLAITAFFLNGCRSTYYAMWESLGKEKRHLLRDEVEQAREDQAEASEEFKDALTRVKELTGFHGGDLENVYLQLKDDYEDCEQRAAIIDDRIASVEQIAADLFAEWETEIGQMTNASFRTSSRQSLARTRERYNQLHRAMEKVDKEGSGVILYLRQEGRGIGLVNKIKAYALQQEQGLDTVQANEELGFKSDMRNYGIGAQILVDLGVRQMRLMTNNPRKMVGLEGYGLSIVEQVPIEIEPNEHNRCYLSCKKLKMGHLLKTVDSTP